MDIPDNPYKPLLSREHLLAQARQGDAQARGDLLVGYGGYLVLLLRARLGADLRSKVDPDDIVQATFLDAHRQFEHFRGTTEAELTSWLRTLLAGHLARVSRQYLGTAARDARLEQQMQVDLDNSAQAIDLGLAANASTPSQHAARREHAVLLARALDRLPSQYREAIVLRHIEGLAFTDVAKRMGRTEDSVQKLWVRGLSKLRQALEKSIEHDG